MIIKVIIANHKLATHATDEAPTRNWKLPKGKDDYGALAGKHEKLALSALEFNMKFCGKDLKVGNGIQANGFLENCVFKQWGVWNYLELWGASGKAVEKARQLLEKHQITKLVDAAKSLKAALLQRNEDMKKNAAKRKCKGSCSTNVLCSACKGARKRTRCSACQHLNCQACLAREQHVHVYTLISESQRAIEELLQEYRA